MKIYRFSYNGFDMISLWAVPII